MRKTDYKGRIDVRITRTRHLCSFLLVFAMSYQTVILRPVLAQEPEKFERSGSQKDILSLSVGKLIILHDAVKAHEYNGPISPHDAAIFLKFEEEYNGNVKALSVDHRVSFFWAAMWHLQFDGYYMERFQDIVFSDCGDEFIRKLEEYIKTESEYISDKDRLYLTRKVLASMNMLKADTKNRTFKN